ncbi:hypothetical protein, partial [Pantoea vagans]|uniref:hypothetical protein n=1 Tax=Pantoea vagans TaxID=470934 RepID=UPI00289CABDF
PTHWSQTSCATKLRYSPMGAHVTATPDQRQPLFMLLPSIAWKARGYRKSTTCMSLSDDYYSALA